MSMPVTNLMFSTCGGIEKWNERKYSSLLDFDFSLIPNKQTSKSVEPAYTSTYFSKINLKLISHFCLAVMSTLFQRSYQIYK
jgi:hypothetical protein